MRIIDVRMDMISSFDMTMESDGWFGKKDGGMVRS
jgi:hypothetical protein